MKYFVTDTHPLLWYFIGSKKLPLKIKKIFDRVLTKELGLWVPIVILLEASLLEKSGKIKFTKSLDGFVSDLFLQSSITMLDLLPEDILAAHSFNFSRDIFDNLIVTMARRVECPLLTADSLIHKEKPCPIYWD